MVKSDKMLSGYTIQPVTAMRNHPELAPDTAGLYALLLDHPDAIRPSLEAASLRLDGLRLGKRPVLYIGATSDSLRRRLKTHTSHDTCRSTFRMSLGAVLAEQLHLVAQPVVGQPYFGFNSFSEAKLSAWIDGHVSIAFRADPASMVLERDLIASGDPLLNIAGRHKRPGASQILELRKQCKGLRLDRGILH